MSPIMIGASSRRRQGISIVGALEKCGRTVVRGVIGSASACSSLGVFVLLVEIMDQYSQETWQTTGKFVLWVCASVFMV